MIQRCSRPFQLANNTRNKEQLHPETTITHDWDSLKSIIKNAAEFQVGYKMKESSKYISDPERERMPKEQKDLRVQTEKYKNHEQMKQLWK